MTIPALVEDMQKGCPFGEGLYGIIQVLIGFPAAGDHPADTGSHQTQVQVVHLPDSRRPGLRELEDDQLSPWLQHPQHLSQPFFKILEIADPKRDRDGIEMCIREFKRLAVTRLEHYLPVEPEAFHFSTPNLQHACGDIDTRDPHTG